MLGNYELIGDIPSINIHSKIRRCPHTTKIKESEGINA